MNKLGDRLFITCNYGFGEAARFTVTDGTEEGTFTRFPPPEFEGFYATVAVGDSVSHSAYGGGKSERFITDARFTELLPLREWAPALPAGRLDNFEERQGKLVFTQADSTTGYPALADRSPSTGQVELLTDLDTDRDSFYLQRYAANE